MEKKTILVIEDEADIIELHRYNLKKEGFRVLCASTGEAGLRLLNEEQCDLLILDLMLPGIGGLELCKIIRQQPQNISLPIIMVTALGSDNDIITGLELGADDYVTKPFSPKVLSARVKSLLRRKNQKDDQLEDVIAIHEIRIDRPRHQVFVKDKQVELSAGELAILCLLVKNAGIVLSRNRIINHTRGDNYPVTERSVDVQILGLRRKLGEAGKNIETVRGIGYRLKDQAL